MCSVQSHSSWGCVSGGLHTQPHPAPPACHDVCPSGVVTRQAVLAKPLQLVPGPWLGRRVRGIPGFVFGGFCTVTVALPAELVCVGDGVAPCVTSRDLYPCAFSLQGVGWGGGHQVPGRSQATQGPLRGSVASNRGFSCVHPKWPWGLTSLAGPKCHLK